MREIAKEAINTLHDYSTLVFWGVMFSVITIMALSIVSAWRNRSKADFYFGEAKGEVKEGTRVPIRKLDYFADVYAGKLIVGLLISATLITLVSLPLILLRWVG